MTMSEEKLTPNDNLTHNGLSPLELLPQEILNMMFIHLLPKELLRLRLVSKTLYAKTSDAINLEKRPFPVQPKINADTTPIPCHLKGYDFSFVPESMLTQIAFSQFTAVETLIFSGNKTFTAAFINSLSTTLKSLTFSGSVIASDASFVQFIALKELRIPCTQIPPEVIETVAATLEYLDISGNYNNYRDVSAFSIEKFNTLKSINLSYTQTSAQNIKKIPPTVTYLDLHGCSNLTGANYSHLTMLQHLSIGETPVTAQDIATLQPSLQSLYMRDCPYKTGGSNFSNLVNLRVLNISVNPNETPPPYTMGAQELSTLPSSLRVLLMDYHPSHSLSKIPFNNLTHLKEFYIDGINIPQNLISAFVDLIQQDIYISSTTASVRSIKEAYNAKQIESSQSFTKLVTFGDSSIGTRDIAAFGKW